MKELPAVNLHLASDRYVQAGEAHLICSAADFARIKDHFVKYFELWSPTYEKDDVCGIPPHGLWPTGFRVKISTPQKETE